MSDARIRNQMKFNGELSREEKEKLGQVLYHQAEAFFKNAQILDDYEQKKANLNKNLEGFRIRHNLTPVKILKKTFEVSPEKLIKDSIQFLKSAISLDHQDAHILLNKVRRYRETRDYVVVEDDLQEYARFLHNGDKLNIIPDHFTQIPTPESLAGTSTTSHSGTTSPTGYSSTLFPGYSPSPITAEPPNNVLSIRPESIKVMG